MITPRPREAHLVIDAAQRVIDCDCDAEALLGVRRAEVRGLRCYELIASEGAVDSTDVDGACGPECPNLEALSGGRLGGATVRRAVLSDGGRLRCRTAALPGEDGCAVLAISEAASDYAPPIGEQISAVPLVDRLAVLATVVTATSSGSLLADLERTLGLVRDASGAEVAELFLREPSTGDLVLTCHRGPFRREFSQVLRFERAAGYPGRVLDQGGTLFTEELGRDPWFIRDKVKCAGFTDYICAPLRYKSEIVGSIGLAFRRPDRQAVYWSREFLGWLGAPLGSAVKAALAEPLDGSAPRAGPVATATDGLAKLLRQSMSASGSDAGEVRLLVPGPLPVAGTTPLAVGRLPDGCRTVKDGRLEDCPALAQGRGEVLYGRRAAWPSPCRGCAAAGGLRLCVPMLHGDSAIGLLRLWRRHPDGEPPSNSLVMIEAMASAASRLLTGAWADQWAQSRVREPYSRSVTPGARGNVPDEVQAPSPTAHLEVRCFGDFAMRLDGRPLLPRSVGRKKTMTLLKVLVAHDGRPVTRDALIEWLWPGGDPRTKASQLYVLVHDLRRALEPVGSESPVYLVSDVDGYVFDPAALALVDVRRFRALAAEADQAARRGDVERSVAASEQAVALYVGDFLEDEPYLDWCEQLREQLRGTCLGLIQRLAAAAADEGAWSRCVWHLRSAVRLEPLREESHRDLMRALWHAGRRDEAVLQYRACEDLLRRELDVAPLPETRGLLETIRLRATP